MSIWKVYLILGLVCLVGGMIVDMLPHGASEERSMLLKSSYIGNYYRRPNSHAKNNLLKGIFIPLLPFAFQTVFSLLFSSIYKCQLCQYVFHEQQGKNYS